MFNQNVFLYVSDIPKQKDLFIEDSKAKKKVKKKGANVGVVVTNITDDTDISEELNIKEIGKEEEIDG